VPSDSGADADRSRARAALRWSTVVVLVVEAIVVRAGRLSWGAALAGLILFELVAWLLAAGQVLIAARAFRRGRAAGHSVGTSLDGAVRAVLPPPLAFLVRREVLLVASLTRWVLRRPDVPPGAVAIAYHRAQRVMSVVFLGLGVGELVVIEVVVPWETVRWVLLVLGIWTLLVLLALVGGNVVRPHLAGAQGLRLRWGDWLDVDVPADRIAGVAARRCSAAGSGWCLDGDALALALSGETTVEVVLTDPVTLTSGRRTATVRRVRFVADDPGAAVVAVTSTCLAR
jgi:hypothetical protein